MKDELDIENTLEKILNSDFWIKSLKTQKDYFRTHDDCDGDMSQGVSVSIRPDGDVYVSTTHKEVGCRFRMPFLGGGLSPRVRNALLILAMAIDLDNKGGYGK